MHFLDGLRQLVVIFLADLLHSVLPVKPLSDNFICLHELVDLAGQFVVLVAHDADVVVHAVDLDLQVGVVFHKCTVRVPSALQLLAHVQKLVLFLSDLDL